MSYFIPSRWGALKPYGVRMGQEAKVCKVSSFGKQKKTAVLVNGNSVCFMIVEAGVQFPSGVFISLTPPIKIHGTGVVEMSGSFPSGARAAVGLPSVPPQWLIRNDCSSRDTRSRSRTANLRHKIAKGAVAQDSEHIRSCTLCLLYTSPSPRD